MVDSWRERQRVEDDFTAQADEYVYQLVRKVTSERLTQEDVIEFEIGLQYTRKLWDRIKVIVTPPSTLFYSESSEDERGELTETDIAEPRSAASVASTEEDSSEEVSTSSSRATRCPGFPTSTTWTC